MSTLSTIVGSNQQLQNHSWSQQEIRTVPTEELARSAYQYSRTLQAQFPSENLFIAHWAGLRQRYHLAAPMMELDEAQLKIEWSISPALQREFNGRFGAYVAFLKADRAGQVRRAGR